MTIGRKAAELVADHLNGKSLPKHVVLDVHLIDKGTLKKFAADCTY
jgi:DNA-binding LacI/PurR family transcriptional regulator